VIGLLVRQLPLPPGTAAPALWGDERHVRKLLGGQLLLDQEPHTVDFRTGDGETRVPSEYLLTVVHRPGA
jgi:hypothetical protein